MNYCYKEIDDNSFDEFVRSHQYGELSQMSAWAIVKSVSWYAKKLALYKDDKLIATSLLLFRKMPLLPYTLCYSPRGFVMDYDNETDILEMIKAVKALAKKERAFTIKIDPLLEVDKFENINTVLTKEGFKHSGFNKGFQNVQVRYTFMVDLLQDDVSTSYDKKVKNYLRKAQKYGVFVEQSAKNDKDNLDIFWQLMQETGKRDDISVRNYAYYKRLLEAFADPQETFLFLAGIEPAKIISVEEKELKTIEKDIERLNKKLSKTTDENKKANYQSELTSLDTRKLRSQERIQEMQGFLTNKKEKLYLSGAIITKCGHNAHYLYAASSDDFREYYPNYYLQYNMMNFAKSIGATQYDMGGFSGYTEKEDLAKDSTAGLYTFKKRFGGRIVERVGEFDCTLNHVIDFCFKLALKLRKLK